MNYEEKDISPSLEDYQEILSFYGRIFPKEEQFPLWLLQGLTNWKKIRFTGYYLEGKFIGFFYSIHTKHAVHVKFFAVHDSLHGQGHGSAMLKQFTEAQKGKTVVLFIETVTVTAENHRQRLSRRAFYLRNGLYDSGIHAGIRHLTADVLSTKENLSIKECKRSLLNLPLRYVQGNGK